MAFNNKHRQIPNHTKTTMAKTSKSSDRLGKWKHWITGTYTMIFNHI